MVNAAVSADDLPLSPASAGPTQAPAVAVQSPFAEIEDLYAAEYPKVFRFFLFSLRDEDAAQSLAQDTFVKAWRTRASFRGECAPATWLMRIAVNLLRDHTRRGAYRFWRRAAQAGVDADALAEVLPVRASSAESGLIARQHVALLWRSVEQLSERQRTVFLLRHVEEMDLAAIAEVTGMPLPTVKTHLYRALEKLRAAIGKEHA